MNPQPPMPVPDLGALRLPPQPVQSVPGRGVYANNMSLIANNDLTVTLFAEQLVAAGATDPVLLTIPLGLFAAVAGQAPEVIAAVLTKSSEHMAAVAATLQGERGQPGAGPEEQAREQARAARERMTGG